MTWMVAAIAGAVLIVLHAIAWKQPPRALLPTARFVQAVSLPSRSRRFIPSDLALLLLRLAALAFAAAALESTLQLPRSSALARVIVVDASRAVASMQERNDSVRAATLEAETVRLVAFDSAVQSLSSSGLDVATRVPVKGKLAAALVAATGEVTRLRARHERVDVVVVSPVVEEEWSPAIAALVTGAGVPVRWSRIAAAAPADSGASAGALPSPESPLGAAAWSALGRAPDGVRIREGRPDAADTLFAREGGLVAWFRSSSDSARPSQAILAGNVVAIGAYTRDAPAEGTPVAWWGDGAVAAAEKSFGSGCVREVALGLPMRGDEALRPAFAGVLRELVMPCDGRRLAAVPTTALPTNSATGLDSSQPADATGRRILLALALAALAAEVLLRRRIERGARSTLTATVA